MKIFQPKENFMVGVISDTHGNMPPGVPIAFAKVDLIIHAGDIGEEKVLAELSQIAPLVAVRGNMDFGKWADRLPQTEKIKIGNVIIYVIHDLRRLDVNAADSGYNAVVSGHTHRAEDYRNKSIVYVNPGSASYPKLGHPASVAILELKRAGLQTRRINLKRRPLPKEITASQIDEST